MINQEIFVTPTNQLALEINNSGVAVTFLKTLVDDQFLAESEKWNNRSVLRILLAGRIHSAQLATSCTK